MTMAERGRVALVTGASSGIGAATVRSLAAVGFEVVGAARRLDRVEEADEAHWHEMYESNVMGVMRVTKALLPALERSGNGHIVVIGSVAGVEVYPGGGGYTAAKHAANAVTRTLRLELLGKPIRVSEVAPGMVETEFSVVRFGGDQAKADKVYEGVTPLT